ncbi:MAG: thioredoxin domain-containing protein [Anaerolineales bacterium]|nr:thioredoxin domain-containing protein [Anaerolineales bacterium]
MTEEPIDISENDVELQAEDEEVFRFKRRDVYIALLPLAFAVGLAAGYLIWGMDLFASAENPQGPPNTARESGEVVRLEIPTDDDPSIGPENAPIVIVEFSDFNCGYCRRWHMETFDPLMAAYPGQIHFVYRDFPVTSAESFIAAQAAHCAAEQGAFWDFHDLLFTGGYPLGSEAYVAYAQQLGLDADELTSCIESGRYDEEVNNDARFASGIGATGTPTFFINGIPLVGAHPLETFKSIIDQELGE